MVLTLKRNAFPVDTHFEIVHVKIGSAVSYPCSKINISLKKLKIIGGTPKGYISPIWEETPLVLLLPNFAFSFLTYQLCQILSLSLQQFFSG